jgi:hypothetical protein
MCDGLQCQENVRCHDRCSDTRRGDRIGAHGDGVDKDRAVSAVSVCVAKPQNVGGLCDKNNRVLREDAKHVD